MKKNFFYSKPLVKPIEAASPNKAGRSSKIQDKLSKGLHTIVDIVGFMVSVVLYSLYLFLRKIVKPGKLHDSLISKIELLMNKLDKQSEKGVSRLYLIEISFKNMAAKKTRTVITVGGMAIGISFIVFLVSVGYGLQKLVVSRVANLEELRQTEVVPGISSDLALNDAVISKFSDIPKVEKVLPLVAVVGRITFQNSVSDIAVYGTTANYLKHSALQPVQGKVFESNNVANTLPQLKAETAEKSGTQETNDEEIREVEFIIDPDTWLTVRQAPTTDSKIIGYTRLVDDRVIGTEVWGGGYNDEEKGKWIRASMNVWKREKCEIEENSLCEGGNYLPLTNEEDEPTQVDGYVAQLGMTVTDAFAADAEVLGIFTEANAGSLPMIELESESVSANEQEVEIVEVNSAEAKQVVVNRSVLSVLNLSETEAIGQEITLSMVVVGELLDDKDTRVESVPVTYTIVGVIPDEGTPVVYVPYMDVRSMGVNKISQLKVIVADKSDLQTVRGSIEAAGYGTVSVADTVAQIDRLFVNFRLLLLILGLVALSVAALGMFNTLTVSLLERTREVGLMKAMGMKSEEIKELFLTESMIMGFYGGALGLFLGTLAGKFLSLLLSALSVIKGVGFVDVSYAPPIFVLTVLFLSVVVGVFTGYFPAKRATKISALNALRYE